MKYLFALIVMITTAVFAFAWEIPSKDRVPNRHPGYCCWAGLETLGRVNGISALTDLVEKRSKEPDELILGPYGYQVHLKSYGSDYALKNKLDALGVRYKMQSTGTFHCHLLKHANKEGCLVAMRRGAFEGLDGGHGIVLTQYDDNTVEFYDPNDPTSMYEATRVWFDYYWTGLVIVVTK